MQRRYLARNPREAIPDLPSTSPRRAEERPRQADPSAPVWAAIPIESLRRASNTARNSGRPESHWIPTKRDLPAATANPTTPLARHNAEPTPTGAIIVDEMNGRVSAYL